jgi:hypothetical protein
MCFHPDSDVSTDSAPDTIPSVSAPTGQYGIELDTGGTTARFYTNRYATRAEAQADIDSLDEVFRKNYAVAWLGDDLEPATSEEWSEVISDRETITVTLTTTLTGVRAHATNTRAGFTAQDIDLPGMSLAEAKVKILGDIESYGKFARAAYRLEGLLQGL